MSPPPAIAPSKRRPRRFPASLLPFPSAALRPIPPPPWLSPLHRLLRRLYPCCSIWCFCLCSLLRPLPSRSTSPLIRRCLTDPGGLIYCSPVPSSPSSPSSFYPPLTRRLSSLLRSRSYLLLWRLPPCPPLVSCGCSPHPAPLPPSLAADIDRKDKDVSNQTRGVVARWFMTGGSAPQGKRPSRPLTVVGDRISFPWFLNRPQQ